MIYIVNGTGPYVDTSYEREMAYSFCCRIRGQLDQSNVQYFRGPSLAGLETATIADRIVAMAAGVYKTEPIYLIGYSRGGSAVINAARKLKGRAVAAMFLFDAVDRDIRVDTASISSNVQKVYHARRDPAAAAIYDADVKRLEEAARLANLQTMIKPGADSLMKSNQATSEYMKMSAKAQRLKDVTRNGTLWDDFGNCGTSLEGGGSYTEAKFRGSHGALGGVPWGDEDVPGDWRAVPQVYRWMWENFRQEGIFQVYAGKNPSISAGP